MPKGRYNRNTETTDYSLKGKDKWLMEHGGRNRNDILVDEKGEYVEIGDGYGRSLKVYIPCI